MCPECYDLGLHCQNKEHSLVGLKKDRMFAVRLKASDGHEFLKLSGPSCVLFCS